MGNGSLYVCMLMLMEMEMEVLYVNVNKSFVIEMRVAKQSYLVEC